MLGKVFAQEVDKTHRPQRKLLGGRLSRRNSFCSVFCCFVQGLHLLMGCPVVPKQILNFVWLKAHPNSKQPALPIERWEQSDYVVKFAFFDLEPQIEGRQNLIPFWAGKVRQVVVSRLFPSLADGVNCAPVGERDVLSFKALALVHEETSQSQDG